MTCWEEWMMEKANYSNSNETEKEYRTRYIQTSNTCFTVTLKTYKNKKDSICVVNVPNASFYHSVIIWSPKERTLFSYFFLLLTVLCPFRSLVCVLLFNHTTNHYDYYEMVFGMILIASQLHLNANGWIALTEKMKIIKTRIKNQAHKNSNKKFFCSACCGGFMTARFLTYFSARKWFFCCFVQIINNFWFNWLHKHDDPTKDILRLQMIEQQWFCVKKSHFSLPKTCLCAKEFFGSHLEEIGNSIHSCMNMWFGVRCVFLLCIWGPFRRF